MLTREKVDEARPDETAGDGVHSEALGEARWEARGRGFG